MTAAVSALAAEYGIAGPACCFACGFEIWQLSPLVAHMRTCAGPLLAPRAKTLRAQHLARLAVTA